jgi:RNA polymerase sigma-70 factor (ECF subfamily)
MGLSACPVAKRLTRAKRKITVARSPYRVPAAHRLGERLRAVLAVIYALFTRATAPAQTTS